MKLKRVCIQHGVQIARVGWPLFMPSARGDGFIVVWEILFPVLLVLGLATRLALLAPSDDPCCRIDCSRRLARTCDLGGYGGSASWRGSGQVVARLLDRGGDMDGRWHRRDERGGLNPSMLGDVSPGRRPWFCARL